MPQGDITDFVQPLLRGWTEASAGRLYTEDFNTTTVHSYTAELLALYLNCFVLVVQSFQKIAVLKALAPTQSELPFVLSQGVVLAAFIIFGAMAVRFFHPVTGSKA